MNSSNNSSSCWHLLCALHSAHCFVCIISFSPPAVDEGPFEVKTLAVSHQTWACSSPGLAELGSSPLLSCCITWPLAISHQMLTLHDFLLALLSPFYVLHSLSWGLEEKFPPATFIFFLLRNSQALRFVGAHHGHQPCSGGWCRGISQLAGEGVVLRCTTCMCLCE